MLLLRIVALLSFITTLCFAQVTEVNDDNVGSLIGKSDEWLLEFYADWCGYCRKFAPKYEAAQRVLASSPTSHHVGVGKVNVETSPGLAARFFVQRLPTIVHIKDHEVRVVPADRMNDLVSIIQDELWQEFQPVNGMTSPFSFIGTMVACTGKMVKWASSMNFYQLALAMFMLIGMVVIYPIYFPTTRDLEQREEEARQLEYEKRKEIEARKDEDESTDGQSTAAAAAAVKPESSESTTKKRKSKRID